VNGELITPLGIEHRAGHDDDAPETATVIPIPIAAVTAIVTAVVTAVVTAAVAAVVPVMVSAMVVRMGLG
jgi:hypothetical protein